MTGHQFRRDPLEYVTKHRARAISNLKRYFDAYTGSHFERLADSKNPNEITELDLVAVTTLSVDIPAPVAIWVLGDGRRSLSGLLKQIPPAQKIWDTKADLSKEGPAWQLWDRLRANKWPKSNGANRMGPTRTSKLLAAKRPHLIPIRDSVVTRALLPKGAGDWGLWRERLSGAHGEGLRKAVEGVRDEAGVPRTLSVLRTLDIVVWMQERGR